MFSSTEIKAYALKKDTYISISLDLAPIPAKQVKKVVKIPEKEQEIVEEVQEVDIGDLFSDVWTKDIKVKKKEEKVIDTKRLELIQKKLKKSDNKTKQKHQELVENIQAKEVDITTKKSSSGTEVNEYLAKIQAIVYKYFQPPANSQGHTVKVVIELSRTGKVVDFRILTYSENIALNEECDKIKKRLLGVLFPTNPQNESFTTIVNITSDK